MPQECVRTRWKAIRDPSNSPSPSSVTANLLTLLYRVEDRDLQHLKFGTSNPGHRTVKAEAQGKNLIGPARVR